MKIQEEKNRLMEFKMHVDKVKNLLLDDPIGNEENLVIVLGDKKLEIDFHADAYVAVMELINELLNQADDLIESRA